MATYAFETISSAQALAILATDTVTVNAPVSGSNFSVIYNVSSISVTLGGRTVAFGANVAAVSSAGQFVLPDGSRLFIGDGGPNSGGVANGSSGADGLFGGGGADTLIGGAGADVLQGNQGDDILEGGDGSDTVYGGQGADLILLGAGSNVGQGNKGADTLSGLSGAETLLGGQDNDVIAGEGGADFLNGNLGDDNVNGGSDGDRIFGEDGADSLIGLGGADTVSGGAGGDLLILGAGAPGARNIGDGGAGDDTIIGGADADSLAGGGDNDDLFGDAGGDTLDGGAGTDIIAGGAGRDQLSGGAGVDTFFVFQGDSGTVAGGFDLITDWESGDRIDFTGAGASYIESAQANYAAAEAFANTQIAAGVDVVAVQVGSDVIVFADNAGNDGTFEDAVVLVGRAIDTISATNIV